MEDLMCLLATVRTLKFIIPERILRTLYCTLVLPYIDYQARRNEFDIGAARQC